MTMHEWNVFWRLQITKIWNFASFKPERKLLQIAIRRLRSRVDGGQRGPTKLFSCAAGQYRCFILKYFSNLPLIRWKMTILVQALITGRFTSNPDVGIIPPRYMYGSGGKLYDASCYARIARPR